MRTPLLVTVLVGVMAAGCDPHTELVMPTNGSVMLEVEGLPRLHDGHFELRASFYNFSTTPPVFDSPAHDEEYLLLGEFLVADDGTTIVSHEGGAPRFLLPQGTSPQLLDEVIITIRTGDDHGDTSAEDHPVILAGRVGGDAALGVASLTLADEHALGSDFLRASGAFTLAAPTSVPSDSNAGVWFIVDPGSPVASLHDLPPLPEEWTYKGWVLEEGPGGGRFFSTGRFRRADSADADGAGPGSGPGTPFGFPGQDFIRGDLARPDLAGGSYSVLVTLEPVSHGGEEPFGLTVLSSEGLTLPPPAQRTRPLANVAALHQPRGRMTIDRSGTGGGTRGSGGHDH